MGRLGDVGTRDAPTTPRKEVFASGMGQRLLANFAVMKDVPIIPSKEESAKGTAQKRHTKSVYVRSRDAPTESRKEESAAGMEQR